MKYREFGSTGIKVSEIGFGAWAIGGNEHGNSYGSTDDRISLDAIHRALDLGCNFFDTADVYGFGHSEELLGKGLRNHRDRAVIATKVGGDFYSGSGRQNFSDDYIRTALDQSLLRLKTDYVDIYQLHNPPLKLIEKPQTYEILRQLKKDGKIRAWGLSIFDPVEGLTALRIGQPDCLQVVYNIFTPKPAEELLPRAHQIGCAIIAREPLANGFLTGKYNDKSEYEPGDIRHDWPHEYILARVAATERLRTLLKAETPMLSQLALKFVLSNPMVSVVIPGIKTAEQAEEDLSASDTPPLNAEEMAAITALYRQNFGLAPSDSRPS
jgi:aryl-alcohol dehydrogenase-like predicted oxidoreductase